MRAGSTDHGAPRAHSLLGEYLRARRARLQPEDVGLVHDEGRRVGGLRRQEVADLARISIDYYLRLEQGRDRQPSDQVVVALSEALQVGDFGLRHMRRLVQLQNEWRPRSPRNATAERTVRGLLALWPSTPVAVVDANLDVVSANDAALALDADLLTEGTNLLLGIFAKRAGEADGWSEMAAHGVAALRFRSDPGSRRLQEVVGRLSIREPLFRRLWAEHESRPWQDGRVDFDVAPVGRLPLRFQALDVPTVEGCSVVAFHAEDPAAEAGLRRLASRAAPYAASATA